MGAYLSASEALDRCFLETRCKIIEIAANLDRIDRGVGTVASDSRMAQLYAALAVLQGGKPDRAVRCQMAFSDAYKNS